MSSQSSTPSRLLALALLTTLGCKQEAPGDSAEPAVYGDQLGTLALSGLLDLTLDGDKLFVCQGGAQVSVVDVSDPTAPALGEEALLSAGGECAVVAVYGSSLYSLSSDGGATRWSLNNLAITATDQLGFAPVVSSAQPGKRLLLAAGVQLEDAGGEDTGAGGGEDTGETEPSAMVGKVDMTAGAEGLVLREGTVGQPGEQPLAMGSDATHLFLALSTGALVVAEHDLTEVGRLDLLAAIGLSELSPAGTPLVLDDTLYLPLGDGGLALLDVDDPEEPVFMGMVDGVSAAWDLASVADRLYVGGTGVLQVLDVSAPTAPALLSGGDITPAVGGRISQLTVDRGVAYAFDASSGTLSLLSVDEDSLP